MSKEEILLALNRSSQNTLMETLQIRYVAVDLREPMLRASMPVIPAVHQPMGFLHGGASAALAESVGSAASALLVDSKENAILGTELSCNHLKGKREGTLYATARLIHRGRSTHLWEIRITDELDNLICHAKLTNRIIAHNKQPNA